MIGAGGVVPRTEFEPVINSLDLMGVATYTPMASLQTVGVRRAPHAVISGRRLRSELLRRAAHICRTSGPGRHVQRLADPDANAADKTGQDTLGFSTTENYSTEFKGWHVNGVFGYAQNVQTLLVTYMNSYYNYSGNVRRNWGQFNSAWAPAARGPR